MTKSESTLLYNVYHKVFATKSQKKLLALLVSIKEKPFATFLYKYLLQYSTSKNRSEIVFHFLQDDRCFTRYHTFKFLRGRTMYVVCFTSYKIGRAEFYGRSLSVNFKKHGIHHYKHA